MPPRYLKNGRNKTYNTHCTSKDWVIKSVPADIWRLTFGLSVSSNFDPILQYSSGTCAQCGEILFSRLNAPELWSKLTLWVGLNGNPSPNTFLVKHALLHAQGCPLTIAIFRFPGLDPLRDPLLVLPYLENVHRTKRLELNGDLVRLFSQNPEVFRAVEAKWDGAKPLLEELVFCLNNIPPISQAIANIWTPSPNLHILIIQNHMGSDLPLTSILNGHYFPYCQLTTLKLKLDTTIADFLAILSKINNLIRCDIDRVIGELPLDSAGSKLLLLAALQDLKLSGSGEKKDPSLTRLLKYINTPMLTSLSLRNDHDWSCPSFTPFVLQSPSNIRDLTLDINIAEEGSLELLPWLQILRIRSRVDRHSNDFVDVFLNALNKLSPSREGFCLFPDLMTIEVDYESLTDNGVPGTPFADMIEGRFRLLPTSNPFMRLVVFGAVDFRMFSCEIIRLLILKRDELNIVFDPVVPMLQSVVCR